MFSLEKRRLRMICPSVLITDRGGKEYRARPFLVAPIEKTSAKGTN